ncbi:MAG: lipase family alpha/beta hydrolase [Anaerolineae bacterium]
MDLAKTLSTWLFNQLEMMPREFLRDAPLRTTEMILDRVVGQREAAEMRALLAQPHTGNPRVATILLPGIMGSLLASVRGISALLWINPTVITDGRINLLDLSHDGNADQSPDVEIQPVGIEKLTYLRLILTLARESRLYEFPYDWRKRIDQSAHHLHESIARWSVAYPDRRFILVGHSMGGMVARTYLALYPEEAEQHVERAILLASPLAGSPVSALIFTGQTAPSQIVSHMHAENDVVCFAANLPASYQLLPPPPQHWHCARPYPTNWDLYDARSWGFPCVRQDYLDEAVRLHDLLAASDPQCEVVQIAGCHRSTVTDIWRCEDEPTSEGASPHLTMVRQECGADSGDDTVPLWSAVRPGITTYYVEERHQIIPGNPDVLDAVADLIHGEQAELPQQIPEPLPVLQRLGVTSIVRQVAELRQRIENGQYSREDIEKLFFAR